MRLYVNTKEVPLLKSVLRDAMSPTASDTQRPASQTIEEREHLRNLLERVILCEELQKSERRAKKEEETDND